MQIISAWRAICRLCAKTAGSADAVWRETNAHVRRSSSKRRGTEMTTASWIWALVVLVAVALGYVTFGWQVALASIAIAVLIWLAFAMTGDRRT